MSSDKMNDNMDQVDVNQASDEGISGGTLLSNAETPATGKSRRKRRKKRGLSTGKTVAVSIIIILYILVIVAVSIVVFYRPEIENKTKVYYETVTDTHGNVIDKVEHVMTRDEEAYNILLLGHDRAAMLTDVFVLVNINNRDHSITIMQVPRDSFIANHDGIYVTTNKINALFNTYYYKYYREGNDPDTSYNKALISVGDTLEKYLAIEIDYSAIMDLNGFRNIVDILGGVEIYIEQGMYYNDPAQNLYINIPAGYQTLTGEMAEGFVRYRAGYTTADLGRQNAQKQFLAALFSKAKSSLSLTNVSQLTELANEIFTNIHTDMSAGDLLYFAQCILQCDLSSMNMMTMPGNLAGGYYVMNRAAMLQILNSSYHVYDKDLTDGMFDTAQIFNGSSYTYFLPPDQVYDNSVYNGEDADGIYIPRH